MSSFVFSMLYIHTSSFFGTHRLHNSLKASDPMKVQNAACILSIYSMFAFSIVANLQPLVEMAATQVPFHF